MPVPFKACHKCTDDRHPGCHATCERYKKDKERHDRLMKEANSDRDARLYEHKLMMKRHNKKALVRKKHLKVRRNYR